MSRDRGIDLYMNSETFEILLKEECKYFPDQYVSRLAHHKMYVKLQATETKQIPTWDNILNTYVFNNESYPTGEYSVYVDGQFVGRNQLESIQS